MLIFTSIINQYKDNVKFLSNNILRKLISYTGVEQGAIFLINKDNEEEPYLEIISSYALDKRRMGKKRIEIGEGQVGVCFKERETIRVSDIPATYSKISSGLGESSPKHLLFIPIKRDTDIVGVIELASLNPVEDYKIHFMEQLSENITSAVSTIRANQKLEILYSRSREQTQQMSAQEEELRQHLEELEATRDQALQREKELSELTDKYAKKEQNLIKKILKFEDENLKLKATLKEFEENKTKKK